MERGRKLKPASNRRGVAIIIAMMFIVIFSSLAVGMAAMSGMNAQLASNHHKINCARSSAESGLEVMRYWLDGLSMPGTVAPSGRLSRISTELQNALSSAGVTNINVNYASSVINISDVTIDPEQSFNAVIRQINDDTLQMDVTGSDGQINRTIRSDFVFATRGNTVFDFGIATKGPLVMSGQTEVSGVNLAIESSVYIEGAALGDSFSITNQASVAGDVKIADPYGTYTIGNNAEVGGVSGTAAHDHVFVGVDPVDFPTPNPEYFEQFATGEVINSSSDWENSSVLENVTIAAGTNPTFASDVTITGVLYIEQPNVVHFAGKSTVIGVIVGDSTPEDASSLNGLVFSGQVECQDVSTLVGAQFDDIKKEKGTFIMAPGFSANFSGQSLMMNGVIAVSGASFSGQAGGTVYGSIINYSQNPMLLQGQSTLLFNRSGTIKNPAGFEPVKRLEFVRTSYDEIVI